jgi:hypothetical protein
MKWKTSTSVFVVAAVVAATIVAWHWLDVPSAVPTPAVADVIVYKDPQCGCCNKWVDHLRRNGFHVTTQNDLHVDKIKSAQGIPAELGACHTAIVEGYVVEGHVPADTIKRLLRERPAIKGIAVAGMPAGSPGMEGPYHQRYNVMSFDASGKTEIYEKH